MMVSGLGIGVLVASIIGGVAIAADREPPSDPAGSTTVVSNEHDHEDEDAAEATSPAGESSTGPADHIGSAPDDGDDAGDRDEDLDDHDEHAEEHPEEHPEEEHDD